MGKGAKKQYVEDFLSRLIDEVLWVDTSGEIDYDLSDDTVEAVMQYAEEMLEGQDPDEYEEIGDD